MKWIGKHVVTGDTTFIDDISLGDGDKIILGDGSDAEIYVSSEDLYIVNTTDDKDIIFQSDDGSGGLMTYFYLDGSDHNTRFPREIKLSDSYPIMLGSGNDLRIYHDGTDSNMDNYTGDLYTMWLKEWLTTTSGLRHDSYEIMMWVVGIGLVIYYVIS